MDSQPLLTTEEVAFRLGVKPATVYAYVSRGLLTSRRNGDGKNSLFAKADVDTFVASRKRTTTPAIQTGITLIRDGELFYRGQDAVALARTSTFEAVINLLWTGDLQDVPLPATFSLINLAAAVTAPLPDIARLTDRMRVIVAAAAAADPLRFDTAPTAVVAAGRQLIATMARALPSRRMPGVMEVSTPLAEILWSRLTRTAPSEASLHGLNAALILLADHDIAASTLAARVAASTRAHPYAVVGAGLAALDGPLHGVASALAYPLLAGAVGRPDPIAVFADHLRAGGPVPGFGHPLHPSGDPRAAALIDLIADGPVRRATEDLARAVHARSGARPNVDLALAAFALHHEMSPDAGEAVFALARTAGWIAHALEEYADRPSRFRPSSTYAGRSPA
ncbi:citrate synthase family protein [Actinoplanes sp. NBRC 101535]|uniref:citrate synthase family protein n=1 Tax=Actinoplanes sp. NBRC 101535 TaxID=3032196 RepID=UPI0024A1CE1B|nr:citrate synthase family protein [Actinoplanes sp. NBRC 101535]GLY00546.1 citrate synthase [Actinoplanes sp. NBRC 101535]